MKKVITMMILMVVLANVLCGCRAKSTDNLYPMSTIVTKCDYDADVVTVTDFNGNDWEFEGVEDWMEGDICALLMDTMGTDIIYDDKIISVRYCGWVYSTQPLFICVFLAGRARSMRAEKSIVSRVTTFVKRNL